MTIDIAKKNFAEAKSVLEDFIAESKNFERIDKAVQIMVDSIQNGGKIFSCGNGGSMCDAMHFAEELSGRFRNDRKALPALAISDASHISCVSNDYGYEYVFSRFLEGLGNKEDVLLGISTSGNSQNVINAVLKAKEIGMKTIVLSGKDGGKLASLADVEIRAPKSDYADRVQEIHIKIIHTFIQSIEQKILGS